MSMQYIKSAASETQDSKQAAEELVQQLVSDDSALVLLFYGADHKYDEISAVFKKSLVPFIGCMDAGRMMDTSYQLGHSIVGMSISKQVVQKAKIGLISTPLAETEKARQESREKLSSAAKELDIDLNNPLVDRDFIINLGWGLGSASPMLDGQSEAGFGIQSVGGSSGGKTDFKETNVVSSAGSGNVSAFALIRLNEGFSFIIDRVTSFDKVENVSLKVTQLNGPREIAEINNKPAAQGYAEAIGKNAADLSPAVFADYTLGLEPGDGERLITSIMMTPDQQVLLTYNDVIEGTEFSLFKAKSQREDRTRFLQQLKAQADKDGYEAIGYISFDCILCYLARQNLSEIDTIHNIYIEMFPKVPKIGFGTFSENQDGSNVNQTETPLILLKKM